MDSKILKSMLKIGETVAVEFKRCGNGIESDTYESVCSFLNRFGGDIFMGVLDDGTVNGVPPKAAPDMVRNFITVISNPPCLIQQFICLRRYWTMKGIRLFMSMCRRVQRFTAIRRLFMIE